MRDVVLRVRAEGVRKIHPHEVPYGTLVRGYMGHRGHEGTFLRIYEGWVLLNSPNSTWIDKRETRWDEDIRGGRCAITGHIVGKLVVEEQDEDEV